MPVAIGEGTKTRPLGNCTTCSVQLPLRFAGTGEQPSLWLCANCGSRYVGVVDQSCTSEIRKNVVAEKGDLSEEPPQNSPSCFGAPQQPIESAITVPAARQGVLATARNDLTDAVDESLESGIPLSSEPQGPAFNDRVHQHGAEPFESHDVEVAMGIFNDSLWKIDELFAALEKNQEPDLPSVERVARLALESAAGDLDLITSLGISPSSESYPTRHSLQVSNLALAIGVTLGYDETMLLDLSTGCLLHDVGMLKVKGRVWQAQKELRQEEFAAIANHPCDSLGLLEEHIDSVSFATKMVVYQTHERLNGSGYPRGYSSERIHDLAKVAAVADAFVALVSPRPHRKALLPYHAMIKLLADVKSGQYDSVVVRALLRTVSLFPLGSYVSLNESRIARVMRSSGEKYTQPVVEVWTPGRCNGVGEIVDLAKSEDLRITGPLAQLPTG